MQSHDVLLLLDKIQPAPVRVLLRLYLNWYPRRSVLHLITLYVTPLAADDD